MLSPDDIRNPARRSGFDHVSALPPVNGRPRKKPYQADVYGGKNDKAGRQWFGPSRATALEAAQDYCDYMNGLHQQPQRRSNAGHPTRPALARDAEVEAALGVLRDARAQRQGKQGYVYCIAETNANTAGRIVDPRPFGIGVKIGYSVNPEARVGELQIGNPRKLRLLAKIEGTEDDEAAMHAKYAHLNLLGEWFSPTAALMSEFGLLADGGKSSR